MIRIVEKIIYKLDNDNYRESRRKQNDKKKGKEENKRKR
jgi:hypothetical protein